MKKTLPFMMMFFLISAAGLSAAVIPHIAFVYPAGATPGSKVTVTIGGQYLKDYIGLNLSGVMLDAQMTNYLRVYDRQEINRVRRSKEVLEAKMAEEESDLRKQQMQRQMDLLDQESAMVAEMNKKDKKDPAMAAKKQFNPQIAERITLEFTLPTDVKPGENELRVITTNGLSNPLRFLIGQMPEVSEVESNNLMTAPQKLTSIPVLVNGQIMPGDVDCFRFHASKGQTLVFHADARSLIPYLADTVPGWFQAVLTLYNAEGVEVAYDDDYRFDPDPVLIYTVPQNGDYILSVRDSIYRGREDFVYRISIGETPFIEQIFPLGGTVNSELDVNLSGANLPVKKMKMRTGDDASGVQQVRVANGGVFSNARDFGISSLPSSLEREPNNQFAQAQAVTNSTVVDGRIGNSVDQDWFSFKGNMGDAVSIDVSARGLGSPLDAKLVLLDAQRKELAASDDAEDKSYGLLTHHADSRINFKLPETGTYFVRLTDLQGKGGPEYAYRLRIGEEQPDFQLRIVPSSLRVPRNGTAIATVHAIRTGGFAGEINLSVLNAPEGIELQRATIPAGVDSARIVIAAGSRAQEQMTALDIEGAANLGWQSTRHRAVPAEDMMQAFIYRHLVTSQQLLVQITEPAEATVALDLPRDGVFRARPGSKIILNSTVKWLSRPRKGVRLTLAEPPEWLALKTSSLTARGGEIMFEVSPNAEPGDKATVLLNGTVRIEKLPEDPDYNPIEKFKNSQAIDFTIDAISVEIIN